jgi:cytoskeletal protein RodZ
MKERILPLLVVLLAVAVVVLGVALLALINLFNTSVRTPSLSTTDTSTDNIQVSTEFSAPIITPTITPGGPPTPTPINIDTLPTPQLGAANAFGRILCNGMPLKPHHPFF